jgi:NAD(P)-dependent dehydrogenase (short-subunit alcohol dehydrogenase family)
MTARSILITGCSSGIGYTCALGMKQRGWRVFATARTQADLERLRNEGLEVVHLDYTQPKSIEACADAVLDGDRSPALRPVQQRRLRSAGRGRGRKAGRARAQFEANVFGWHDLTRRLIPAMRDNGAGRIVQCSSVLGLVALKWRGAYSASKFAIEALSDTMRLELETAACASASSSRGPSAAASRSMAWPTSRPTSTSRIRCIARITPAWSPRPRP